MAPLDEHSSRTLRGWTVRAGVVAGFVLAPSLLAPRPFNEICNGFSASFTVAALVTVLVAMWRREQPGIGSLNRWDESIAFNAVAILAHMAQRLQV